jgi:hypothetical protein
MGVIFGSILHADEKRLSIHIGIPGEMIALTGSRTQNDVFRVEVPLKLLFELRSKIRIRLTSRLRAVKGRWAVAFPVIDVATAHASGVRRFHQAASRPPTTF